MTFLSCADRLFGAVKTALMGEECRIYFAPSDISNGEKKCLFKRGSDRLPAGVDSDEGGHLFQSDRGHHSNLMAAS